MRVRRDHAPKETSMGRLLKRLIVLGIVGFVVYRALVTLGVIGSDDDTLEFDWGDDDA
jgi:hypothetical protein